MRSAARLHYAQVEINRRPLLLPPPAAADAVATCRSRRLVSKRRGTPIVVRQPRDPRDGGPQLARLPLNRQDFATTTSTPAILVPAILSPRSLKITPRGSPAQLIDDLHRGQKESRPGTASMPSSRSPASFRASPVPGRSQQRCPTPTPPSQHHRDRYFSVAAFAQKVRCGDAMADFSFGSIIGRHRPPRHRPPAHLKLDNRSTVPPCSTWIVLNVPRRKVTLIALGKIRVNATTLTALSTLTLLNA